jgi:hypothetical protein
MPAHLTARGVVRRAHLCAPFDRHAILVGGTIQSLDATTLVHAGAAPGDEAQRATVRAAFRPSAAIGRTRRSIRLRTTASGRTANRLGSATCPSSVRGTSSVSAASPGCSDRADGAGTRRVGRDDDAVDRDRHHTRIVEADLCAARDFMDALACHRPARRDHGVGTRLRHSTAPRSTRARVASSATDSTCSASVARAAHTAAAASTANPPAPPVLPAAPPAPPALPPLSDDEHAANPRTTTSPATCTNCRIACPSSAS